MDCASLQPGRCVGARKTPITGNPDPKHISTNYAERANLTMRMHMRRFISLTNGFSKKIENHDHSVALFMTYYNFVRIHKTLRVTPAMAAGVSDRSVGSVGHRGAVGSRRAETGQARPQQKTRAEKFRLTHCRQACPLGATAAAICPRPFGWVGGRARSERRIQPPPSIRSPSYSTAAGRSGATAPAGPGREQVRRRHRQRRPALSPRTGGVAERSFATARSGGACDRRWRSAS